MYNLKYVLISLFCVVSNSLILPVKSFINNNNPSCVICGNEKCMVTGENWYGVDTDLIDNGNTPHVVDMSHGNSNSVVNNNILFNIFENLPEEKKKMVGESLVKWSTSMLAKADSVGHIVLHTNDKMINFVLSQTELPTELKKEIILNLIDIARHGDETGGTILSAYHDLVNHML